MLRFDLSYCNMFLGDFAKAWDFFNAARMRDIGPGEYYKRELRELLTLYHFRNQIEQSK